MKIPEQRFDYDVVQTLSNLIPTFHCIIVTEQKGGVHSYLASDECENCHKFSDLSDIAKLFSLRMNLGDYNKTLGEFELVVVVFKEHYVIGRILPDNKNIIIIFSRNENLESHIEKIINIIKGPFFSSEKKFTEYKEKLKPIPPLPVDYQKEKETVTSKQYMLVASSNQPTRHKFTRLFGYRGRHNTEF